MARHIHIHAAQARDAAWEESKHKRDSIGQFSTTGSSGGTAAHHTKQSQHHAKEAQKAPAGAKRDEHLNASERHRYAAAKLKRAESEHALGNKTSSNALLADAEHHAGRAAKHEAALVKHDSTLNGPLNSASASGKLKVDHASLAEGQALYNAKGEKVDEIESIGKRTLGSGKTLHTRAGYQVHIDPDGSNAQGYSNKKPAPSMSFKEIMGHPDHRAEVDSIEDMMRSLEGKENDPHLPGMIAGAVARLKEKTGYDYHLPADVKAKIAAQGQTLRTTVGNDRVNVPKHPDSLKTGSQIAAWHTEQAGKAKDPQVKAAHVKIAGQYQQGEAKQPVVKKPGPPVSKADYILHGKHGGTSASIRSGEALERVLAHAKTISNIKAQIDALNAGKK